MQRQVLRGAAADAGLIFHIFAQDSTSTTGAGKASVGFGSWTCRYIRSGEAISGAITPEDLTTIGTYAAPTANTNIRIKAVDNTNMIGVYEVQIHLDWVNTTNTCQSITIYLTASGVAVLPIQIPLTAFNPQLLQASWTQACTEPTAVVAASPTAIAALSWLLTLSRNKITQTATTQLLKADDGATTIATSTVSDDGTTATRGEFA